MKNTVEVKTISREAIRILASGIGFHSDDYSSLLGKNRPKDVIDFEINKLGNTDIPEFIASHYQDDCGKDVVKIDSVIKNLLHSDYYSLIWLCATPCDVSKQNYADRFESIYQVNLPRNSAQYMLVSDLGQEGCLLAYAGELVG